MFTRPPHGMTAVRLLRGLLCGERTHWRDAIRFQRINADLDTSMQLRRYGDYS
ncbi:hypothetical protein [Burkholderia humptydooensis]|uniref:hypothetical protein n=1 Tax=Burkholderia humptydooensis TaxID=430531 RepID=UPI00039BF23F|nr:hypothetical protein [Burkholderia humptydooensis]